MTCKYSITIWKPIPNFEGLYEVSSLGQIRNAITGRILKPFRASRGKRFAEKSRLGYPRVWLYKDGTKKKFRVHQIVASVFIGPCPKGKEVNHKDGDKTNNNKRNLEYLTRLENIEHAHKLGLRC